MIDVAPIRLPRRDIAITGTSKNLLDAVGLDDLMSLLKMTFMLRWCVIRVSPIRSRCQLDYRVSLNMTYWAAQNICKKLIILSFYRRKFSRWPSKWTVMGQSGRSTVQFQLSSVDRPRLPITVPLEPFLVKRQMVFGQTLLKLWKLEVEYLVENFKFFMRNGSNLIFLVPKGPSRPKDPCSGPFQFEIFRV